ncbi:5-(carboxyamino)imidazole ribonucleotide synthase [Candidatus Planktophila vernalis]|uniref:5-(carboxyamino)imidazole ribonucleotide synthase n=1 Tax=Candidatus Planktophila vernalis TaxID=1884907 RepID=UPI000BAC6EBC|nr:5-(carboxyamino)imidazole ribonucleotide synthase [Candidatus Planktophila vernalis]
MSNHFPTVGVIGAGQLARMSVAPAAALGVNLLLLANNAQESGAQITNHVVGDYKDLETVRAFSRKCDVITFEHELIPLSIVKALEADGVVVRPSSASFIFSQDKAAMRERLSNFPSPKNAVVTKAEEVREFPVIAKAISGGYDGRGVWKINSQTELAAVLKEVGKVLIEELIDFDYEIAVMVARSPHGQATTWAPTQTIQRDGICVMTITPAPQLSNDLSEKAQRLALDIANEIGVIGVMAVEIFVKGQELFINELAMRPHNSGHWTIEGSLTSQFEQHLRAVLDLPLGNPQMTAPIAVMGNILGGDKEDMYRPYLHLMARTPELKFHHYKKEVRPGRKIGHVNLLGDNLLELTQEVQHALDYMSGEIDE